MCFKSLRFRILFLYSLNELLQHCDNIEPSIPVDVPSFTQCPSQPNAFYVLSRIKTCSIYILVSKFLKPHVKTALGSSVQTTTDC